MDPVISTDDPTAPDVRAVLEAHLAFSHQVTPAGHVHALAVEALLEPSVSFFSARFEGVVVGVGALKRLSERHAELKSMHTVHTARRRGVGRAMVEHLLAVAANQGYERVSLETGTIDAFAPARSLYAKIGFRRCEPFGDYTDNPHSVCTTLLLRPNRVEAGTTSASGGVFEVLVRHAAPEDLPAITNIANALLDSTTHEWTEVPHTQDELRKWLDAHAASGDPVLVADHCGHVIGWAAYGDFRDTRRWPGYRYTVEHSIHISEAYWRHGVGRALLSALMEHASAAGKRVMIGAIDSTNERSIAFHRRFGFEEVGRLPGIGEKFGRMLDLVLMQRPLTPPRP